jgi:hypothetical protein
MRGEVHDGESEVSDITRYTAFADSVQPADYDWGKDFYVEIVLATDCAALEAELALVKAREMETVRQLAEMTTRAVNCDEQMRQMQRRIDYLQSITGDNP